MKEKGDEAVKGYSLKFDKVSPDGVEVSSGEIAEAVSLVSEELKAAIRCARSNIEGFHKKQVEVAHRWETMPGVTCWRKTVAIEKSGSLYTGRNGATVLHATDAGHTGQDRRLREIVLCSPPDLQGRLHPAILYAAQLVGVTKIFKIGGVQAIAAMAYGTETVPKVYKIFGPGNQYVTCAKQLVQKDGLSIDMPAGPSEVAVYADETANPFLRRQIFSLRPSMGVDSQVILVSSSMDMVNAILSAVDRQVAQLPRGDIARKALANSRAFIIKDEGQAMELLNEYAPEHLILACRNAEQLAEQVINAGSVFLGHYSPESVGDYASGTNHVLAYQWICEGL